MGQAACESMSVSYPLIQGPRLRAALLGQARAMQTTLSSAEPSPLDLADISTRDAEPNADI